MMERKTSQSGGLFIIAMLRLAKFWNWPGYIYHPS